MLPQVLAYYQIMSSTNVPMRNDVAERLTWMSKRSGSANPAARKLVADVPKQRSETISERLKPL